MGVNNVWNKVKTCLLKGVDQVCGWTRGGRVRHVETWCWNDVDQYIKEKQRLWKLWKMVGFKEDYLAAKSVLNVQYTILKRLHKKHDSLT